eukprot:c22375_g1_i1 orf=623-4615(+)
MMADPVEIILDFLQRNQFAKAEAAFKAELLVRSRAENPVLSSENVLDWDMQLRTCVPQDTDSLTHDIGRLVISTNEQTALSAPERRVSASERSILHVPGSEKGEIGGSLLERTRSPPEKQLYVEYEAGQSKSQEPTPILLQDFAFKNSRTLPESEATVPFRGTYVSCPIHEPESTAQGPSWLAMSQHVDRSLPGMSSITSSQLLPVKRQSRQEDSKPAEQASAWGNEQTFGQQQFSPTSVFINSPRSQDQEQQACKSEVQRKDIVNNESKTTCSTSILKNAKHDSKDIANGSSVNVSATKEEVEGGGGKVGKGREEILQVKNGFLPGATSEGPFKNPALKTFLPLSFLKASQNEDQHRSMTLDLAGLSDERDAGVSSWNHGELQNFEIRDLVPGRRAADHLPNVDTLELSANGPEMLPRLPPVRIHSVDQNLDLFKEGGSAAENENSTSMASTPEGALGWGMTADGFMSQDMSALGLKRIVSRPSVSQGIVEDMSEQLSGAVDGQSERWYPDDYCDSDTWEDDDDPGYHRQPIEDEEWFLAHEIDYPSDDERARQQHMDKNLLADAKQPTKRGDDDQSFVEEESYFSGEEYYRQQAAKKESHRPQQSEPKDQVDQSKLTHATLFSTNNDSNLLTLSRGNDDGNDYDGQIFDSEEINLMVSRPVWKGFMYQANESEQTDSMLGGYELEDRRGGGVDDDNHGSVRSGLLVSSDAADVGSEVRDSLLGGSSEGDVESLRYQELVAYGPAHGNSKSQGYSSTKEGRHVEVKSAPVRHLDEDEDERNVILQYYSEEWGHSKRSSQREAAGRSSYDSGLLTKEQPKGKNVTNNKAGQDNGGLVYEGFSFPSPSSTGDIAGSRAGSGKSLWSNRESLAQGEETDGYVSGMVGPDDTLAAWKRKSNDSSPGIASSEDNLPNVTLSNHSSESLHSTDEYVSLEVREDGLEDSDVGGPDVGGSLPKVSQPSAQEEEDAGIAQEEMRTLGADEDQYEIFDLRIIHRKNRTGFEEDKDFPVMINSVVAGRYHVTEYLGSAAFSKAIQAHDLHTGMDVCMKIIKNNKDFFDQSLDEIKLLKFVNKHDPADKYHILRLYDYFYHREHLFIVCELLRANLYEFHKFNRESGGEVYFTMPRLQSITLQCLEALEFLHRLGIIHCDLKPENILVKSYSRCEIKIIDLGSSCFQSDHLCSYVQSRSYRAPEVILGLSYDQKIDIWSLGCILAELCTGNVLFQNDSLATLLARVVGILGPIHPEVLAKGRDTHKYFTKNHMLYERNQETDQLEYLLPKKTSLSHRLPMGDQGFVEFVGYLLQNNPAKRPTASEALRHPWLSYPYEPISS